jgi:predicted glycoside hydrolase/deacetylase ChbG (UPF0249 family)
VRTELEPALQPSYQPQTVCGEVDTLNRVKRLIVNADDFGLTAGVNRAILQLNARGSLTSATLMAVANATHEAMALAPRTSLGVGCHIVLVDGTPVLSSLRDIPSITNLFDGRFPSTLGGFLRKVYGQQDSLLDRKRIARQIEAEAAAQIAFLQSHGLKLTHIDTHKHTHMFPAVLRPVLRAARAASIRAVRNPFEPQWSIHATPRAPRLRRTQVRTLRFLERAFHRIVQEEGFVTTNGAIGVLATGTLDAPALASLLQAMPDGTWELVTHPGYNDSDLAHARTRLLASREIEQAALTSVAFPPDVELIHFGYLTTHNNT